mmetsp:Transcript_36094/g.57989  ORF Transcript_36094/g.57989 Transcript_36094/m.57989 type:complete len:142 (+) Transcript_36094:51-476(+)
MRFFVFPFLFILYVVSAIDSAGGKCKCNPACTADEVCLRGRNTNRCWCAPKEYGTKSELSSASVPQVPPHAFKDGAEVDGVILVSANTVHIAAGVLLFLLLMNISLMVYIVCSTAKPNRYSKVAQIPSSGDDEENFTEIET